MPLSEKKLPSFSITAQSTQNLKGDMQTTHGIRTLIRRVLFCWSIEFKSSGKGIFVNNEIISRHTILTEIVDS